MATEDLRLILDYFLVSCDYCVSVMKSDTTTATINKQNKTKMFSVAISLSALSHVRTVTVRQTDRQTDVRAARPPTHRVPVERSIKLLWKTKWRNLLSFSCFFSSRSTHNFGIWSRLVLCVGMFMTCCCCHRFIATFWIFFRSFVVDAFRSTLISHECKFHWVKPANYSHKDKIKRRRDRSLFILFESYFFCFGSLFLV